MSRMADSLRTSQALASPVMLRSDPLANPEPLIRRVYAYVAYRIGDGPDAEDVTSETFERALRYRASFEPAKGEAASWLVGIARRLVDGRGHRGTSPLPDELETVDGRDLEEDAVTRLTIQAAVATLDEREQELIALRYGADLTARQIGELLDVRANTIEVALHRALGRLRAELESQEAPEHDGLRPALDPVRV
jgi:RNA polymerase sigma-70 factor, ECF subfamily